MSVPKYDELYSSFLNCMFDGKVKTLQEIVEYICLDFNLSEEDKQLSMPKGSRYIVDRTAWTATYLKKAGLILGVSRGKYQITSEGKNVVQSNTTIDNNFLMQYETFVEFKNTKGSKNNTLKSKKDDNSISPQEKIQSAIDELNVALIADIKEEISKMNPYAFEKLVIDLLVAMGYGSMLNNQSKITKKSGDEGIDGILAADKFGFDAVYVQAKKWDKDSTVGRPEIQKFGGAMMGQGANKGLFITTAKFSNEAVDYAERNLASKIVLVDGDMFAKFMIEYDVGVSTTQNYKIKNIDSDFFETYY